MTRWMAFSAGIVLLGLVGCENANVDRLGSGGEGIVWAEHEALFDPEMFGGIDMAIDYGDLPSAMQHAASPEFQAAVTEFKNSELPAEISDRTAQRDELVAALETMVTAAEENNASEFQSAVESARQANQSLMAVETAATEEE